MIAITGIGIISALGPGREALREGLLKGKSNAGGVRDFDPKEFIPGQKTRRMSRFSRLSLCSAVEAVKDAGLAINESNSLRTAVIVGTGLASTESTDAFYGGLLEGGPLNQNPMIFPETVPNIAASQIAMHFGIKGPNTTFSQNETSSLLALWYAMELLKDGHADVALVTGAEELSAATITGFGSLRTLSKGSRMMPFDRRRDGFVLGEGAATLVIERLKDAEKRGANVVGARSPYVGIGGISLGSAPVERLDYDLSGRSMADAMKAALKNAGMDVPDMVSAAANSSEELDSAEALALKEVFGERKVAITALRAYTGFFLSDGALRIAGTALCLKEGIVPPIPGLEEPDAGMGHLEFMKETERRPLRTAIVNSFSTGGSAACVALKGLHI